MTGKDCIRIKKTDFRLKEMHALLLLKQIMI